MAQENPPKVLNVSIINLIATPDEYANKLVQVRGFLIIDFEENAIYLHKEDAEQMLTKNGLRVSANQKMMEELAKLSGRHALIQGVFKPPYRGPLEVIGDSYSGYITEVRLAKKWVWDRKL